jgi:hypothetical protein
MFWDVAAGLAAVVTLSLLGAVAVTALVCVKALLMHVLRRIPAWPVQSRARP